MRYVIDACNLIFKDRRLEETLENRGFPAVRELLVAMLTKFARSEDVPQIVCVFDGSEKAAHRARRAEESQGRIVLVYADPRTDADRYIIELVEDARRPGELMVVSSDKFVVRNVQRAQGHTMSCRDFLRQMRGAVRRAADPLGGEDPRKFFSGALTDNELDDWAKWMSERGGGI
jgi:predicted RNA-binding protein with PIN domain